MESELKENMENETWKEMWKPVNTITPVHTWREY